MNAGGRARGRVRLGKPQEAVGEEAPMDLSEKVPVSQQHQQPRENQDGGCRAKTLDLPFLFLLLCTAQWVKERGGEGGQSHHCPRLRPDF